MSLHNTLQKSQGIKNFLTSRNIYQKILLAILCTSFLLPIFGVFLRFRFLGGGILLLDILLGFLFCLWGIGKIFAFLPTQNNFFKIHTPLLLFWGISAFSLLINALYFSVLELLTSGFYFVRFLSLSALTIIIPDIFSGLTAEKKAEWISRFIFLFFCSCFCLAVLGFFQLWLFPNFKTLRMEELGWDPHIGRLLSTWFDPNFLGGLFSFALTILLGVLYVKTKNSKSIKPKVAIPNSQSLITNKQLKFKIQNPKFIAFLGVILAMILFAGLILTFSRSALLAFCISTAFFGVFFSRKILLFFVVIGICILPFSERLQTRIYNGIASAQSIFWGEQDLFFPDPTAKLRLESWQSGWQLFLEKPFLGHGFNTLKKVQIERGLLPEHIHSASGIDSSFLTILATTGLWGCGAFMWWIFGILLATWYHIKNLQNSEQNRGLSIGFFCGLLGLFAHSFFVNSFLFPWIMVFVFSFAGIMLSEIEKS